jgi:hypothetical protein
MREKIRKYKKTQEYRDWCAKQLEPLLPAKNKTHLKQLKKQVKKTTVGGFILELFHLPIIRIFHEIENRDNNQPS